MLAWESQQTRTLEKYIQKDVHRRWFYLFLQNWNERQAELEWEDVTDGGVIGECFVSGLSIPVISQRNATDVWIKSNYSSL